MIYIYMTLIYLQLQLHKFLELVIPALPTPKKISEAGTVINSPVSLQIFVKHVPERGGRHQ
jgi:hypothetical protein